MATASTGIYWCLVLTGSCVSFVVSSASLVQTVPPNSTHVCPGGRLVLTCTASADNIELVIWKRDSGTPQAISRNDNQVLYESFSITAEVVNGRLVSNATIESVPVDLNGVSIVCADGTGQTSFAKLIVNVTNITEAVTNVTIIPTTDDILIINWNTSVQCIDHYNVTINSNNTHNESRTTNTTNITINDLIIGTNYSFIIIPIDAIKREGPPSSLIQYTWNVPVQVVNISWDQISTDSITIWWSNYEDYSTLPVPPIQYYIINVYNTSNSIIYTNNTTNTNITITGLPLTDTNYTVTIIPVNVIGYGPSATVNVNITITMTSTSSITSVSSSATLSTDISTSTTLIVIPSTSITASSTIHEQQSSYISATGTSASTTTTMSTSVSSSTTVSTTAAGSNTVPVISGAIGTVFVIIIIIIIIILVIVLLVLAIKKQKNKRNKISKKADTVATPTYDEIIVKPTTTTTGVPIYDTSMELQANTAYDVINKDMINVHNNDAYGQIMM